MFPKTLLRLFAVANLFIFALALAQAQNGPSRSQVPSQIVMPVDDSVRVMIPNSKHPMANPAFDIGPLEGSTTLQRMILVLGASPDQEYQARTMIDGLHTGGSPNFHRWLTPEEFGQKFGPSQQDIAQVTNWLHEHGFTVGSVAKSGRWIEFSGSSAQVETAFQTQMRQYMVQGELHVANASNISIPAALSPVVRGVLSLHNFFSKPMIQRSHHKAPITLERGKPNITASDGFHAVIPGDLANIYNLNPLFSGSTPLGTVNGTGQTIAIVAEGNINTAANNSPIDDIATFRSVFGLPPNAPNIIFNGPDPGLDGASDEATLDVEYAGAVAPNATIDLVLSGGGSITTDPIALSSSFVVDQNLAGIMNVSFGICEQVLGSSGNNFWNALWEQAAAQGISVFVSSGDTGAAGCDPNLPSSPNPAQGGLGVNGFGSTAFNTAVGGTEFNEAVNGGLQTTFWNPTNSMTNFSSAIGYIPEMVWNDSCTPTTPGSLCELENFFLLGSGGGGVSTMWAVPSYQTLTIEGLTGANFPNRPVPDVSLNAAVEHDPYIFCFTPDPTQPDCQVDANGNATFNNLAGGTSFASPDFAGIMALVDQAAQNPTTGSRQGLANFVLYTLASTESQGSGGFGACNSSNQTNPATPPGSQCVFNDITAGSNGVPGNDTLNGFVPPGDQSGQEGYNAVAGYDPAVGLGSVNATTLVTNWVAASKNFQGSVTTLSSTAGASINITHGTPVQFTVTVTKNPTGTGPTGNVAVVTSQAAPQAGAFSVGAGALLSGAFTGSFNDLPGGSYNVTAHYPGNGTFAGSDSNAIPATVGPENTTTTLQSFVFNQLTGTFTSGTTVGFGDPVNILLIDADTSGVSGLLPSSGNVGFADNGTGLTSIPIDNSGISEFADCFSVATCFTVGQHSITAAYGGDGLSYNASAASAPITITVTKGTPIAVLASSATTIGGGEPDTVSVQMVVSGITPPTGTVQIMDGGNALGSPLPLSGGKASAQVAFTTPGQHQLTAQYPGDNNFTSANSGAAVAVDVPFALTATTTSQTVAAGATATYNLTLAGEATFSGQVNFNCTGAPGGATCAVNPTSVNLASSGSAPVTVTVSNTANARLTTHPIRGLPFVFAGVLVAGFVGFRRKSKLGILMCLGVFLIAGLVACGGGGGSNTPPPTNATMTVTGTNASTTSQIQLTLTVTH